MKKGFYKNIARYLSVLSFYDSNKTNMILNKHAIVCYQPINGSAPVYLTFMPDNLHKSIKITFKCHLSKQDSFESKGYPNNHTKTIIKPQFPGEIKTLSRLFCLLSLLAIADF